MSNSDRDARIRRVLLDAAAAIGSELDAAGHDEVEAHPILRDHQEVLERIKALLDSEFW